MPLACVLILAAACGDHSSSLQHARVTVETRSGQVRLDVEVADTPDERRRGLMGRASLPDRAGMLFGYAHDTRTSFWMKDTPIPLSIAFLDAEGRILAILDMEPCSTDPCPTYGPGVPYRAALEVNLGTFDRLGAAVGDAVRIER